MSFQWYFLNDLRFEPDGDKGWIAYAPEDSAAIEDAYQAGKTTAALKNWTVHVKKLYQYRNDDHQRQRPVKRAPPGLDGTSPETLKTESKPAMTKDLKTVLEYQVAIRVLEDTHTKRVEELNTEHAEKIRLLERALETSKKKAVTDLEHVQRQHQIETAKLKAEIGERERQNAAQKESFDTELAKAHEEFQARDETLKKKHQELADEQKKKNQDALSKLYEQARADADLTKKKHQEAMDEANIHIERLKADLAASRDHIVQLTSRLKALEAKQKVVHATLRDAQQALTEDSTTQLPLSLLSQELDLHPVSSASLPKLTAAPTHQEQETKSNPSFAARTEVMGGSPTQEYREESDDDVDLRGGGVDPQATQAYSPDSPKTDLHKRKRQDGGYSEDDLGETDVDEAEGGQPSLATQKLSSLDSDAAFSQGRKRQG